MAQSTRKQTGRVGRSSALKVASGKAASPRRRRGIGRPPAGATNAVGREALISKACELLERMPSAQVTRAEVARSLGVDPSLIRYYFRDRSTLMLAAVERMTSQFLVNAESAVPRDTEEAAIDELRARVKALLRLIYKYPHFHQLIVEELAGMSQPEARRLLETLISRGTTSYQHIFQRGRNSGQFRDVDVPLLFIAIIGVCEFFVSGHHIVRIAIGKDRAYGDQLMEFYGDFVCDLILKGIQAPARK